LEEAGRSPRDRLRKMILINWGNGLKSRKGNSEKCKSVQCGQVNQVCQRRPGHGWLWRQCGAKGRNFPRVQVAQTSDWIYPEIFYSANLILTSQ